MPGRFGCIEEEEAVKGTGGLAAAVIEGVEGGLRKSWYLDLVHLFTYVFLIRILFCQQIVRRGGFVSHIFLFYFIRFFRF